MLDSTIESVNSALKRARSGLQRRLQPIGEREPPPAPGSPAEQALVAKFVRAYESGDVNSLVAMLTADVSVSMPPFPFEYQGARGRAPLPPHNPPPGPALCPRPAAGKWSPGVGALPPPPRRRHPPRGRPPRPHPYRRPGLRHDPLRKQ